MGTGIFVAASVLAMLLTMAFIPLLVRYAQSLSLVALPSERKVHQGYIPEVGGLAMLVGVWIPVLLWLPMTPWLLVVLGSASGLLMVGAIDDRADLSWRTKLVAQAIASACVVLVGETTMRALDLPGIAVLPTPFAELLAILVLLAVINAVNLADGLDGLAGGLTGMSLAGMALLALWDGRYDLLLVSLILMGSILGFLRFNSHPASVFMGDSGALFLGLLAGVLAIEITQTRYSPALPLLLLGMPIFDTISVVISRLRAGRSPMAADRNHTHHKLLGMGLSHEQAVVLIYLASFNFVAAACLLRHASSLTVIATFFGLSILFTQLMRMIGYRKFPTSDLAAWLTRWLPLGQNEIASILGWLVVGYGITRAASGSLSADFAVSAALAAVLLISANWLPEGRRIWADRGGRFVAMALLALTAGSTSEVSLTEAIILVPMAILTLVAWLQARDNFRLNSLDVLLLLLVCGWLLFDATHIQAVMLLLLLFYALELALTSAPTASVRYQRFALLSSLLLFSLPLWLSS